MTKFERSKFSVGGDNSPAYDANYDRTFGKTEDCAICGGDGVLDGEKCEFCEGTGKRPVDPYKDIP